MLKALKLMGLADIIISTTINSKFSLSADAKAIIDAIEHFNKTGEITAILLPGFDQTGKWVGAWENPYTKEYERKLKKVTLEDERIYSVDKEDKTKRILNTSYIDHQKMTTLNLTYTKIMGRVELPKTKKFIAPFLTEVKGPISLNQCKNCDTPHLKSAQGFVNLKSIESFFAPELEKVKGILNLYFARNIQCPKLQDVPAIKLESCPKKQVAVIIKGLNYKSLKKFIRFASQTSHEPNPHGPKGNSTYSLLWKEIETRKLKQKLKIFSKHTDPSEHIDI